MDRIKSQTHSLLISFEKFLKSHNLKEKKILIAVSGGVDSLVLVDLFYRYKLNFSIAHCNFNLRGRDSEEDEVFVSELAKKYNATFNVIFFCLKNSQKKMRAQKRCYVAPARHAEERAGSPGATSSASCPSARHGSSARRHG